MILKTLKNLIIYLTVTLTFSAQAGEFVPYPEKGKILTGEEIAIQTHAAARGGLVKSAQSVKTGRDISMLVNRAPINKRGLNRKPSVNMFETYIKNEPDDPALEDLTMAIITSGKIKGTGVLLTNYTDKTRDPVIEMWLPALRKLRTMNAPSHEDTWGGSNLTYGELILRRPEHEVHELLGEGILEGCLASMQLDKTEITRFTRKLPEPQCGHKGRPIYKLKSTTKFTNWWYDYHISEIDKETFAFYRTVYFKGDKKVKTVTVDWQSLEKDDPRVSYPRYIYSLSHDSGKDSMIYVPRNTITLNIKKPDSFWSAKTLKKLGR